MNNYSTIKTCPKGHKYDHLVCPECPVCSSELLKGEESVDFIALSMPARRALLEANIKNLKEISKYSEKELLKLHGFGPKSIKILKPILQNKGLSFKK
jgi:DNA-directed RNA polymerase alpha subunit